MHSPYHLAQRQTSKQWQAFYDQASAHYHCMNGDQQNVGHTVTEVLLSRELIASGAYALDLGCGPGTLTLPLARKGVKVTAVDASWAMLQTLQKQANSGCKENITLLCQDVTDIDLPLGYDLIIAANFPWVFNAHSLNLIERAAPAYCVILFTDNGLEHIKERIRQKLTGQKADTSRSPVQRFKKIFHDQTRSLQHEQCVWEYIFQERIEVLHTFYCHYFSLFYPLDADIASKVDQVLKPIAHSDIFSLKTQMQVDIFWWTCAGRSKM